MANKRGKKDVDAEVDLHGLTVEQLRLRLQRQWADWRGFSRVRIIHGQGTALKPEVERWAEEMGLPYKSDAFNPGSLLIYPRERTLPDKHLGFTLRDVGLRLTPEQEAELRDPAAIERARQEEKKRRQEEEKRRQADAAARREQQRKDESMWEAELARLDKMEKQRSGTLDAKPTAPRIIPPSTMLHQEGYWRGELVRVADTDTDTLKKQKRTGLDKLAPPIEKKSKPATTELEPKRPAPLPVRNTAEDEALFAEAMAELDDFRPGDVRRAKRD